jgi:anti-sigma factor RsiW
MSDQHVEDHLSAYLDQQLPEEDRAAVEAHLSGCAECGRRHQELIQMRELLKGQPVMEPPESFYTGVLEKIEKKKARPLSFIWGMPMKALATACVVMLVVFVTRDSWRRPVSIQEMRATDQLAGAKNETEQATAVKQGQMPPSSELQLESAEQVSGAEGIMEPSQSQGVDASVPQKKIVVSVGPREEAYKEDKQKLRRAIAQAPASVPLGSRKDVRLQARDMGGFAAQNSFADRSPAAAVRSPMTSTDELEAAAEVDEKSLLKKAAKTAHAADKESVDIRAVPQGNPFTAGELPEWRGSYSGVRQFRTVAVRSSQEWTKLWREHTGTQKPPLPVDFSAFR